MATCLWQTGKKEKLPAGQPSRKEQPREGTKEGLRNKFSPRRARSYYIELITLTLCLSSRDKFCTRDSKKTGSAANSQQ